MKLNPKTKMVTDPDPYLLTPGSLALVLGYLHRFGPRRLSGRRFIPARHLQRLAAWLGLPAPQLRTLARHQLLAAHIALAHAAGFLSPDGSIVALLPPAIAWLQETPAGQLAHLLSVLDSPAWPETLAALRLADTLTIDYTTYVRQMLSRQLKTGASSPPPGSTPLACWLPASNQEQWRLAVPCSLPAVLIFDLLQLGDWSPDHVLTCTPLTVAAAGRCGYGRRQIFYIMERATGGNLPADRGQQLDEWLCRAGRYRVTAGFLLETTQEEYLAEVLQHRRFRPHIREQISPRHALVSRDMLPGLQRWLAGRQIDLHLPPAAVADVAAAPDLTYGPLWLGLRLLVDLHRLVPLPCPPPHHHLDQLGQHLTAAQQAELDQVCRLIMDRLRAAINGRDAFFPAQGPVDPALRRRVETAIHDGRQLEVLYQSLGEHQPRARRLTPLRLEQRGELFYLHAYCHRTEMNLTFRLDRMSAADIDTP